MEQKFNNEVLGISAEIAIAETFDVGISDNYRMRGDEKIINLLKKDIFCIFTKENIPFPSKHVAEGQNSIDFILKNKKTLSVKTSCSSKNWTTFIKNLFFSYERRVSWYSRI